MCGIIGITSQNSVVSKILECLKRLEYRGYDSTGIATLNKDKNIECRRAVGKIVALENLLATSPLEGSLGIGHTRWATHGAPHEKNAHPIHNEHVAVVHNGIIENFDTLKKELIAKGFTFTSETDTETVVHLISDYLSQGLEPKAAVFAALKKLEGAFAIAVLFKGKQDLLIGARRGSPLVLGFGEGEMYLGSDALGLASLTNRIAYLEEGDWAVLTPSSSQVYDAHGNEVERQVFHVPSYNLQIAKNDYPHFMLKEIYEQPGVVGNTLANSLDPSSRLPSFSNLALPSFQQVRFNFVACGTSYYATMIAKYWFEELLGLPVNVDIASEFRYRNPPLTPHGVALFVSQSGETADTLAALKHAKAAGQYCIAIVNVTDSSIARLADYVIITDAGPEIGVASTKAFTCQLTVLLCLAIFLAHHYSTVSPDTLATLSEALTHLPSKLQEILLQHDYLKEIAHALAQAQDVLYLGRSLYFPLALEGALKLKELSYIHAEGFAAGEMKHGPIALIDDTVPVIVLSPSSHLFDKTLSNTHEILVRGGKVIFLSDAEGCARVALTKGVNTFTLPTLHPLIAPIAYALPLQLLAYYTAVRRGTDVDQPRNLAKSVTVE